MVQDASMTRGTRGVVAAALLTGTLVLAAGCSSGSPAADPAVTTTATPVTPSKVPIAPVWISIELPATTMVAGSTMKGHVVVHNRTGRPLHKGGCGSLFQVALASDTIKPQVAWAMCLQPITIPTGTSSYPVQVLGTYNGCSNDGPHGDTPACLPGSKVPPLPAGPYRATLYQSSTVAAAPTPIPVQVTNG
jgi:hypothetical protein